MLTNKTKQKILNADDLHHIKLKTFVTFAGYLRKIFRESRIFVMNYKLTQHVSHRMRFDNAKQQGRVISKTLFLSIPNLK